MACAKSVFPILLVLRIVSIMEESILNVSLNATLAAAQQHQTRFEHGFLASKTYEIYLQNRAVVAPPMIVQL